MNEIKSTNFNNPQLTLNPTLLKLDSYLHFFSNLKIDNFFLIRHSTIDYLNNRTNNTNEHIQHKLNQFVLKEMFTHFKVNYTEYYFENVYGIFEEADSKLNEIIQNGNNSAKEEFFNNLTKRGCNASLIIFILQQLTLRSNELSNFHYKSNQDLLTYIEKKYGNFDLNELNSYISDWYLNLSKKYFEFELKQNNPLKFISAIVACRNEALTIPYMYQRLKTALEKFNVDYEIIFTDNDSTDNSVEVLNQIIGNDERVLAVQLSRNFGSSQSGYLSGLSIAKGNVVVLLDGDLQDPPELIEKFIEKWEQGFQVVYGSRPKREGKKWLAFCYRLFYRIFRKLSYIEIPLDASDFSLMDRVVVDEINKLPESDFYLRGLRAYVGFKQTKIEYIRPERMFGKTTANWRSNFNWAKKGIFSFTFIPIEIMTYLGFFLIIITILVFLFYLYLFFSGHSTLNGITTLVSLVIFFGVLQIVSLSIIGEYISKIFEESKKRPKFIIKNIIKNKSIK